MHTHSQAAFVFYIHNCNPHSGDRCNLCAGLQNRALSYLQVRFS